MSLIDALGVIRLLGGVTTIRALIGDWDDYLGRIGIPAVVQLGRGVARDVARGVSPGHASPSRAGAPELAVVTAILWEVDGAVVVYDLCKFPDPAGVITRD